MMAYFGFIGVAIVVVDRQFPDPVFGIDPAAIAVVGYALLTIVLVGLLYSFSAIHEAIQTADSGDAPMGY